MQSFLADFLFILVFIFDKLKFPDSTLATHHLKLADFQSILKVLLGLEDNKSKSFAFAIKTLNCQTIKLE